METVKQGKVSRTLVVITPITEHVESLQIWQNFLTAEHHNWQLIAMETN